MKNLEVDQVKASYIKRNFKDLKSHRVELNGDNSEKT